MDGGGYRWAPLTLEDGGRIGGTMADSDVAPAQVRKDFVALLESSRRSLASSSVGTDRAAGPSRILSREIRISPSRVSDFLTSNYSINVAHVVDEKSPGAPRLALHDDETRIKKAVSGFAASVQRTLSWLRLTGRLQDKDYLTTELVVRAYWPETLSDEFSREAVTDAIIDGVNVAGEEVKTLEKIRVQLWIVSSGPFVSVGGDEHADAFSTLGRALIKTIDPISFNVSIDKEKSLSELLNLPAPDRRKGRAITMGPFDLLYRRFLGFRFVTIPLPQIPLIGLSIRLNASRTKHVTRKFRSLFDPTVTTKRVVLDHEVGHLVLSSMLPKDVANNKDRLEALSIKKATELPDILLTQLRAAEDGSLLFVSDATLAFEMYARLSGMDLHIEVVSEWESGERKFLHSAFGYAPGIMLRDQDSDFAVLLDEAQQRIFRSHWRIEDLLLEPLMHGTEDWLDRLPLSKSALGDWPDHAPVFLIPKDTIRSYVERAIPNPDARDELVANLARWVNQRCESSRKHKAALQKLFKVSPPNGDKQ